MKLGAIVDEGGTTFRVWAPRPARVELLLVDGERRIPLERSDDCWQARVEGVRAGARYFHLLDGERRRPDPASRAQPDGVHGASEVIDPHAFAWKHARVERPLAEWVIYELHIGAFTREGTFDAAAAELGRLADLGVTAVELMPVNSFPGARNWGYDGVGWFAPQASYGGPEGLRRFVDAAHARGLSVIADVVYNHLGPEGNYLAEFAPYFTTREKTPWGEALDYTAPAVRRHILENVAMYCDEFRIDALRLDAVHAIADGSPRHIVAEIAAEAHARGVRVIAESDLGDVRVIERDGWGCDAQWSDDLHHALHAAITGERARYYLDFGAASQVARAVAEGFVLQGERSQFRARPFGTPSKHLPGERFVVCSQNHDQIGNRPFGERLAHLVPGCEYAAAAVVLTAPALPLLFMGEEHSDPAPFLYYTDHGDPALRRAVSEGRRREFDHAGEVPDPQAKETFLRSRIDLSLGDRGRHAEVRRWYRALLRLRRERRSLRALDKTRTTARGDDAAGTLLIRRWHDTEETLVVVSLSRLPSRLRAPVPRRGQWRVLLDAAEFGGAPVTLRPDHRALTVELGPLATVVLGAM